MRLRLHQKIGSLDLSGVRLLSLRRARGSCMSLNESSLSQEGNFGGFRARLDRASSEGANA
jgi:hypothetical protein